MVKHAARLIPREDEKRVKAIKVEKASFDCAQPSRERALERTALIGTLSLLRAIRNSTGAARVSESTEQDRRPSHSNPATRSCRLAHAQELQARSPSQRLRCV